MNIYHQQHLAHRDVLLLDRLAASPNLSPREAAAARALAGNARARRGVLDRHLVSLFFPTHHHVNVHRLIRDIRRDGDDSPEHIERMLMLAREVAQHIDGKRDPIAGGPHFGDIASRWMEQLRKAMGRQMKPEVPRRLWHS